MKGIMIFTAALLASTAVARAEDIGPPPTNAELQARIDALEQELQANEQRQAASQATAEEQSAATMAASQGWWTGTKISGRAYIDFSDIEHKSNGIKQPDSGANFDLKRFYISVDHDFDSIWSADITTDVTYDGATKASQIYIKKAYLQAKVAGDMLVFRLGSADLPWVPFMEDLYGYRYIENTLIDRTKFGTSADWGAHFLGKLAGGLINYQVSVINGAGYKVIPVGGGANRSNSIDVEGRINLNYDGFVVGVGGYSGKLGKDVEGAVPTHHTANRFDAVAAYSAGDIRAGVEYFNTNNWNSVTSTTPDSAEGWGGFASYKFMPDFAVFGRYDYVTPNHKTNGSLHGNYYNFGVTWSPAKIVDLSLVYKHDQASNGTIATSNGSIGGAAGGAYSEVGIFTQLRW
jgi:hypothetical protein